MSLLAWEHFGDIIKKICHDNETCISSDRQSCDRAELILHILLCQINSSMIVEACKIRRKVAVSN